MVKTVLFGSGDKQNMLFLLKVYKNLELRIIQTLFDTGKIERAVVTMYGNDLLKQWVKECLSSLSNDIHIFRNFETEKELPSFLLSRRKALLIASRDADLLYSCVNQLEKRFPG